MSALGLVAAALFLAAAGWSARRKAAAGEGDRRMPALWFVAAALALAAAAITAWR